MAELLLPSLLVRHARSGTRKARKKSAWLWWCEQVIQIALSASEPTQWTPEFVSDNSLAVHYIVYTSYIILYIKCGYHIYYVFTCIYK